MDTNVTLNCIAFRGDRVRPIVDHLNAGKLIAFTSTTLRNELVEVLHYPRLRRFVPTEAKRDAALAVYDAWTAQTQHVAKDMARWHTCALPRVKGSGDQHLLDLALQYGVKYLVTKDRELLKCAPYVQDVFTVITPADLVAILQPEYHSPVRSPRSSSEWSQAQYWRQQPTFPSYVPFNHAYVC